MCLKVNDIPNPDPGLLQKAVFVEMTLVGFGLRSPSGALFACKGSRLWPVSQFIQIVSLAIPLIARIPTTPLLTPSALEELLGDYAGLRWTPLLLFIGPCFVSGLMLGFIFGFVLGLVLGDVLLLSFDLRFNIGVSIRIGIGVSVSVSEDLLWNLLKLFEGWLRSLVWLLLLHLLVHLLFMSELDSLSFCLRLKL